MTTVTRKDAVKGVTALEAIARRGGIPALTGIKVSPTVEGQGLKLEATDLETAGSWTVGATYKVAPDPVLIPAKLLKQALKSSKAPEATLEVTETSAIVDGAHRIRLLPVEDYPTLAETGPVVARMSAETFRDLVARVEPSASGDTARPVLTGVLIETTPKMVRMVATDSYRMTVCERDCSIGVMATAILPAHALKRAAKWIGARPSGDVSITLDALHAEIHAEGWKLAVRVIEAEFPNWQQLIPDAGHAETTIRPNDGFVDAVRASGVYSGSGGHPLHLECNGSLKVWADSPGLGRFEADGFSYRGEPVHAAFQPAYLLAALAATDNGPIELGDHALKPAVLRGAGTTALVMPVRVSS